MIVHDRSKVHTAEKTQAFFKNHQLKSLLLPGKSPDLNPIGPSRARWGGTMDNHMEKEHKVQQRSSFKRKCYHTITVYKIDTYNIHTLSMLRTNDQMWTNLLFHISS